MSTEEFMDKFKEQMDDLWYKYLKHCAESKIEPATREQFAEAVRVQMLTHSARDMAQKIVDKNSPGGINDSKSFYVSMRQEDMRRAPVQSEAGECQQCQKPIWIDVKMRHVAKRARAIICNHCVEELDNNKFEDILEREIKKIDE